jgi:hypothetical protein
MLRTSSSTTPSTRTPTLPQAGVLRAHQFRAENFGYDPKAIPLSARRTKQLHFQYTSRYTTDNGYVTHRRIYECFDCADCPLKSQCTKAKGNRKIRISFQLAQYRQQARENLTSEEGKQLRAARSTEVETVYGISSTIWVSEDSTCGVWRR